MFKEFIAELFNIELSAVTWLFITAQIIGLVNTVFALLAAQIKNIKAILVAEIAMNVLAALNYIFLGGFSGSYICLLAIVQTSVSFIFARKKREVPHWLTAVFLIGYIALSLLGFKSWFDIIPALCAAAFALSVVQKAPLGYRIFRGINTALWIIYDISVGAYSTVIMHGMLLISIIIALVRYDIFKIGEKQKADE